MAAAVRASLFAAIVLSLLLFATNRSFNRAENTNAINADMLALLPDIADDPAFSAATKTMQAAVERRQIFVVSHAEREVARRAAEFVASAIEESRLYSPGESSSPLATVKAFGELYAKYRYTVLADDVRRVLRDGQADQLVVDVVRDLYSPVSSARSGVLANDPFLLTSRFLSSLDTGGQGTLSLDNGMLSVTRDGIYHVVQIAELGDSPFSFTFQEHVEELIVALTAGVSGKWPGAELQTIGVIDYAMAGTHSARNEISTVGLGSMAAIIILFLLTFRGIGPLFVVVLTVGCGVGVGYSVALLVFGEVHILALVGGASLIGISVDYAFHFLSDRFREGHDGTGFGSLKEILPPTRLGWATSMLGFGGLYFSGFMALEQIAVFSGAGLTAALLIVALVYPVILRSVPRPMKTPPTMRAAQAWMSIWQGTMRRKTVVALAASVVLLAGAGIPMLSVGDDIRLLSARDPVLVSTELKIMDLIGGAATNLFFLVEGSDAQALLEREETFRPALNAAVADGQLESFVMLSSFVPSRKRQLENLALVRSLGEGSPGPIDELTQQIGLAASVGVAFRSVLDAPETDFLEPDDWLSSSASARFRHLWMGAVGDRTVSAISLTGVRDRQALEALAGDYVGLRFVDPVARLSVAFGQYRQRATVGLLAAFVLVAGILLIRYGLRDGLRCLTLPVAAAAATLGALGLLGEAINLFHVVGLFLVLGMGLDYLIFFREGSGRRFSSMLAILLAATSTEFAFGLLALSETGAIHAFGQTVMVGIVISFVLAPLSLSPKTKAE